MATTETKNYVSQFLTPHQLRRRLQRLNLQEGNFAELLGKSRPWLSVFMNGKAGLSDGAQLEMLRLLRFLDEKIDETKDAGALPPDLNRLDLIRSLWEEHRRACDEAEVLRLADEIRARESVA